MKDQILLLISALLIAAASWLFWHFLGQDAYSILLMITALYLFFDNARLRRILKAKAGDENNSA